MNLYQVKQAVDANKDVRTGSDNYKVIKDSLGQYLIWSMSNNNYIGLHGKEGTKYEHVSNGWNFYIKD